MYQKYRGMIIAGAIDVAAGIIVGMLSANILGILGILASVLCTALGIALMVMVCCYIGKEDDKKERRESNDREWR